MWQRVGGVNGRQGGKGFLGLLHRLGRFMLGRLLSVAQR